MRDLIALARAKPGQLTYASSGSGSSLHLCGEDPEYLAKIDLLHVPYKGAGLALPDLRRRSGAASLLRHGALRAVCEDRQASDTRSDDG